MIRIAIAEDEALYAQQLQQYIEDYGRESGYQLEVTVYHDGEELLEHYRTQFDIILLDVEMPFMDGMTAAEHIRKIDPAVVIMFVTNMAQYAIQGYAVNALDYILKPLNYFSFSQRLGRAIQHMKQRDKTYLTIPVKGGAMKVDTADIYFVESQGHRLVFHTRSGNLQSAGAMRKIEETLAPSGFFRCNNGYLVNLDHVDGIQDGCALVKGERLLISRPRKAAFLEALTKYVGGLNQ